MNIRLLTLASIAAVPANLPAVCDASSDEVSLAACAKVFAAGLSTHRLPADKYRISFTNRGVVETAAQYESGSYTYELTAREPSSGAVIASASCNVNEDGAVTALSYFERGESVPALAAR